MRDNQERFESHSVAESLTTGESSAPMSFVSPTEIVELPSSGKFYPQGHPLHNKESLEIKFMTAKEEDILTNRSLIKKGVVIDRLLQSLVVDKTVKVQDLLIGDKNALLLSARIAGYGEEYNFSVACPACQTKSQETIDLQTIEHKQLPSFEEENVTLLESGLFLVTLPKSKVNVTFRLLTGKDEAEITKRLISNKVDENESNATSQLKRIMTSVNGDSDPSTIKLFSEQMPAMDARFLRGLSKRISPDVEMKKEFSCSSCGHEEEVEIPFTVEFFWPK